MSKTQDAAIPHTSADEPLHLRQPALGSEEGTSVEEAEVLAREDALRHSTLRAPR